MYSYLKVSTYTHNVLPLKKKKYGSTSEENFKSLLFAFLCGADCLDDLEWLRLDSTYNAVTNNGMASTTADEFIRSFSGNSIELLQEQLIKLAFFKRSIIKPEDQIFELSIDSTPHLQTGLKMEGLQYDYKKELGA